VTRPYASPVQDAVFAALRKRGPCTVLEAAHGAGVLYANAWRAIERLRNRRMVRPFGKGYPQKWEAAPAAQHLPRMAPCRNRSPQQLAVLDVLARGPATAAEIAQAAGLSRDTVSGLLHGLCNRLGLVRWVGHRPGKRAPLVVFGLVGWDEK
jgi:sugar-specific transcriptional regulator TrmB